MSNRIIIPSRVVDYFLVVGASGFLTPEKQALQTKDERASLANAAKFGKPYPVILDRYPFTPHKDCDFPHDVPLFCFPNGFRFIKQYEQPETFSFVMTEGNGNRVYALVFRYCEKLTESSYAAATANFNRKRSLELKPNQPTPTANSAPSTVGDAVNAIKVPPPLPSTLPKQQSQSHQESPYYASKCFVITSHWPFFTQFSAFLNAISALLANRTLLPYPFERILTTLVHEIPLPPCGQFRIVSPILPKLSLVFARPPPNTFPLRAHPFLVFQYLSIDNILLIFAAILTERRVLFITSHLDQFTIVCENFLSFIFPFSWRHIYIPLLPQPLSEFICAPMPYIMGMISSTFTADMSLDQVLLVDLEKNECKWCTSDLDFSNPTINPNSFNPTMAPGFTMLPPKSNSALQKQLRKLLRTDSTSNPIRQANFSENDANEIISAFLAFFIRLLARYRDFLAMPTDNLLEKFDKASFVESNEEKGPFLQELTETQLFQCFIDDRYDAQEQWTDGSQSTPNPQNFEIIFFDENIESFQSNKSSPFLLDTSHAYSDAQQHIGMSPNRADLQTPSFTYPTFPLLSESLTSSPRPIPSFTQGQLTSHSAVSSQTLKFFTEKRLFSLHFHTLKNRSDSCDFAMTILREFLLKQCSASELYLLERDRLQSQLLENMDSIHTTMIMDNVWTNFKTQVIDEIRSLHDLLQYAHEVVLLPALCHLSSCEIQLRLMFAEATSLEGKVTKAKTQFERTKMKAQSAMQRYDQLRTSLHISSITPSLLHTSDRASLANSHDVVEKLKVAQEDKHHSQSEATQFHLSPFFATPPVSSYPNAASLSSTSALSSNDISRLMTAHNEKEEASVEMYDAEQWWQAMVKEYEERMPLIITTIRALNYERMIQFKWIMKNWSERGSNNNAASTQNLEILLQSVLEIDADKEIASFCEGTFDFWESTSPTAKRGSAPSRVGKVSRSGGQEDGRSNARNFDKEIELSDNPVSYPPSPVSTGRRSIGAGADIPAIAATSNNNTSSPRKVNLTVVTVDESPMRTVTRPFDSHSPAPNSPVSAPVARQRGHSAASGPSGSQASPRSTRPHPPRLPLNRPNNTFLTAPGAHHVPTTTSSITQGILMIPLFFTSVKSQIELYNRKKTKVQTRLARIRNAYIEKNRSMLQSLNLWSYPIKLWGNEGWETALFHAVTNKRTLKEFVSSLESWASLIDYRLKRYQTLLKNWSDNLQLPSQQARVWNSLQVYILDHMSAYSSFGSVIQSAINHLKIVKGEIKFNITAYNNSKLALEKELSTAVDSQVKANAKRTRSFAAISSADNFSKLAFSESSYTLLSMPQTSLYSQKTFENNLTQCDKLIGELLESDSEHVQSDVHRQMMHIKNERSKAYLLYLFQKNDRIITNQLQRAMHSIIDSYEQYRVENLTIADEKLTRAIRSVQLNSDFRECVEIALKSDLSVDRDSLLAALAKDVQIDFSQHLPPSLAPTSFQWLTQNEIFFKRTCEVIEELKEIEHTEAKMYKKLASNSFLSLSGAPHLGLSSSMSFSSAIAPPSGGMVHSSHAATVAKNNNNPTLKASHTPKNHPVTPYSTQNLSVANALLSFNRTLQALYDSKEKHALALPPILSTLYKTKDLLKQTVKSKEKSFAENERMYKKHLDDHERAKLEEKKAEESWQSLKARVEKEMPNVGSSSGGSFMSSFLSTSVESLKQKERLAYENFMKLHAATKQKDANLQSALKTKNDTARVLLREVQTMQERAWSNISTFFYQFFQHRSRTTAEVNTIISRFEDAVNQIDAIQDLVEFLTRTSSGMAPSITVMEEVVKFENDYKLEKEKDDRELLYRAQERERKQQNCNKSREGSQNTKSNSKLNGGAVPGNSSAQDDTQRAIISRQMSKSDKSGGDIEDGDHDIGVSRIESNSATIATPISKVSPLDSNIIANQEIDETSKHNDDHNDDHVTAYESATPSQQYVDDSLAMPPARVNSLSVDPSHSRTPTPTTSESLTPSSRNISPRGGLPPPIPPRPSMLHRVSMLTPNSLPPVSPRTNPTTTATATATDSPSHSASESPPASS